jgi:hypothetical protein
MEAAHFIVDYVLDMLQVFVSCERAVISMAGQSSCNIYGCMMCFLSSLHFHFHLCLDVVLIRHGTTLLSNARLYIELQLINVHPYHFHLMVML